MDDEILMSRMDGGEKKADAFTVRLIESRKLLVDARWKQERMESASDYLRKLVEQDYLKAAEEFKLLAEAMNAKVIIGNTETADYVRQHTD